MWEICGQFTLWHKNCLSPLIRKVLFEHSQVCTLAFCHKLAMCVATGWLVWCTCNLCEWPCFYESPVAQWWSIQTSYRKVIASTPIGRTWIFFFQACLCHWLRNTCKWGLPTTQTLKMQWLGDNGQEILLLGYDQLLSALCMWSQLPITMWHPRACWEQAVCTDCVFLFQAKANTEYELKSMTSKFEKITTDYKVCLVTNMNAACFM